MTAHRRHRAQGSAREYALGLLAARAYTVRNLRRKLGQKGFDESEASETIERLVVGGLLDDTRFAEAFVRGRISGSGASRVRLSQQLRLRGVDATVAEVAIEAVFVEEGVDVQEIAERAARKKIRSLGGLDRKTIRRRTYAYLVREGYPGDVIRPVLAALLDVSE